ncbi:hypothetical protein BGZ68_009286 [Mortierella alpina]|nr:hypothetical protein BGZ68_009286 [Mortierella alpina]
MKFSSVFIGLMSLVAAALASEGVTPEVIAAPVDDGPVQLDYGLIKPSSRQDMCLAAIKTEVETQIQLQLCDQHNKTQIWKFKPSMKAIQLAFPHDNNSDPQRQCLSAVANPNPKAAHHLTVAPCTEPMYEKRFHTTTSTGIEVGGVFTGYCFDVPSFNYAVGTQVIVYKCKIPAETNQQWVVSSLQA